MICKAAISKRAWTILANKDSIWAKWMHLKYLKNRGMFWDSHPKQSDSKIWKDILEHRNDLPPVKLGNGRNSLFWHDPWCDQGRLIDKLGWNAMQQIGSPAAYVADFIVDCHWVLPPTAIAAVQTLWNSIRRIYIPKENVDDKNIWKPMTSSEFSLASTCAAHHSPSPQVAWAHAVWHKRSSSKILLHSL